MFANQGQSNGGSEKNPPDAQGYPLDGRPAGTENRTRPFGWNWTESPRPGPYTLMGATNRSHVLEFGDGRWGMPST